MGRPLPSDPYVEAPETKHRPWRRSQAPRFAGELSASGLGRPAGVSAKLGWAARAARAAFFFLLAGGHACQKTQGRPLVKSSVIQENSVVEASSRYLKAYHAIF